MNGENKSQGSGRTYQTGTSGVTGTTGTSGYIRRARKKAEGRAYFTGQAEEAISIYAVSGGLIVSAAVIVNMGIGFIQTGYYRTDQEPVFDIWLVILGIVYFFLATIGCYAASTKTVASAERFYYGILGSVGLTVFLRLISYITLSSGAERACSEVHGAGSAEAESCTRLTVDALRLTAWVMLVISGFCCSCVVYQSRKFKFAMDAIAAVNAANPAIENQVFYKEVEKQPGQRRK